MSIKVSAGDPLDFQVDVLVLPVFEAAGETSRPRRGSLEGRADRKLSGGITALRRQGVLSGKPEETVFLSGGGDLGAFRVLLVGLGKAGDVNEERVRSCLAAAAGAAGRKISRAFALHDLPLPAETAAEAAAGAVVLSDDSFDRFRKPEAKPKRLPATTLLSADEDLRAVRRGARVGEAVARGTCRAREFGNLPANHAFPRLLVKDLRRLARKSGLSITVLNEKRMEELGMGSLLSVSKGSAEEAYLCILEWNKEKRRSLPTVCLVGKGLTFDSGGISLKPAADMDKMRHDKCGAAAVVGTMEAAAALGLKVHLVGIVALVENMPGPAASRPGDVVTAMNGTTIEILNTDAEGRLVLADALLYAARFKPEVVIDLATLTGAVLVALGKHRAGAMGTAARELKRLRKLAEEAGEPIWELPMGPEYDEMMKGRTTDLKNLGGRYAGTITAGHFLSHFVQDLPWIHLDIAGVAWDDEHRPYNRGKGATGWGVRMLTRYLADRYGRRGR